jgi:hypothetical protein
MLKLLIKGKGSERKFGILQGKKKDHERKWYLSKVISAQYEKSSFLLLQA